MLAVFYFALKSVSIQSELGKSLLNLDGFSKQICKTVFFIHKGIKYFSVFAVRAFELTFELKPKIRQTVSAKSSFSFFFFSNLRG